MSAREPVLIVGAGLGGLVFAQALNKAGIPYRIFERDTERLVRSQGWALSLHPWMVSDLIAGTSLSEKTLSSLCSTRALNLGSRAKIFMIGDGQLKVVFDFGDGTPHPFVRVSRQELRDYLLEGVSVEWGRTFKSYQADADGVTVHFEDGTEVKGAILVGADGTSSRVRKQLAAGIPGAEPSRLPLGLIVGELVATKEQYQRWMKLANSFAVGLSDTRRLFVGVKDVAEDLQSARYYWMFGWYDEAATKPDYWTMSASREEMHTYIMSHLDGLNEEYTEPIRQTPVEGILTPPIVMRDMVPPTLPRGKVTLIGDAVHPMVPFRGEGGNMAMKDALSLASSLAKGEKTVDTAEVLKEYEAEMTERATKSVLQSRASTFPKEYMEQQ